MTYSVNESVEIVLLSGLHKGKSFKVGELNAKDLIAAKKAVLKTDFEEEMLISDKPKRGRPKKSE